MHLYSFLSINMNLNEWIRKENIIRQNKTIMFSRKLKKNPFLFEGGGLSNVNAICVGKSREQILIKSYSWLIHCIDKIFLSVKSAIEKMVEYSNGIFFN